MDQNIIQAEAKLEYLSSDAETIALYRAREATLHERANMINSAKEEGREEGRSEEKLETARNMLAEGLALPLIIKITGLTQADITKLQMELKDSVH
jgi:predicted transposase/invertase (TIGR01784 family)